MEPVIQCDGFSLQVFKLPKGCITNWALRAMMQNQDRYRAYYYKKDAIANIEEWRRYDRFGFEVEYYETSALTGENVNQAFLALGKKILDKQMKGK